MFTPEVLYCDAESFLIINQAWFKLLEKFIFNSCIMKCSCHYLDELSLFLEVYVGMQRVLICFFHVFHSFFDVGERNIVPSYKRLLVNE